MSAFWDQAARGRGTPDSLQAMIVVLLATFFFKTGHPIVDAEIMDSARQCIDVGEHLEADAKGRDFTVQSVRWACYRIEPKPSA
jgi:hypothetical protein